MRFKAWLAIALASAPAHASELWLSAEVRGYAETLPENVVLARLRLPGLTSTRTTSLNELQLQIVGAWTTRPHDTVGFTLGLDTGLLAYGERFTADGRTLETRATETLFLGETFVELQPSDTGVWLFRAGKLRPRLGQGAIFDSYGFGISADVALDLAPEPLPLAIRAHALLPDGTFTTLAKDSPLLSLELQWLGEALSCSILGVVLLGQQDGLAPLISDALVRGRVRTLPGEVVRQIEQLPPPMRRRAERRVPGYLALLARGFNNGVFGYDATLSGAIGWTGTTARWRHQAGFVRATFLVGLGQLDADVSTNEVFNEATRLYWLSIPTVASDIIASQIAQGPLSLRAWFGLLEAQHRWSAGQLDLFGLFVSGDDGLPIRFENGSTWSSFVSVAPLLPYTSIFLNGGVAANLASPTLVSVAPDGAGLLGGGLGATWLPHPTARLRAVVAAFTSPVGASNNEANYLGTELNLSLRWAPWSSWALRVDGGVFFPGGYYGDLPPGWQLLAGAQGDLAWD